MTHLKECRGCEDPDMFPHDHDAHDADTERRWHATLELQQQRDALLEAAKAVLSWAYPLNDTHCAICGLHMNHSIGAQCDQLQAAINAVEGEE